MGSPQFGNQNSSSGDSTDQSSGESHAGAGGGGTLYDAIYLASNEILKKQPGQHVIVLISDGIDHDSKETVNDAIDAAQAAHAAIFAIYLQGRRGTHEQSQSEQSARRGAGAAILAPEVAGIQAVEADIPAVEAVVAAVADKLRQRQPHADGKPILEHLCSATGGYMVEGKKDKADESFAKLTALLKNQYTLSWTPDKDAVGFRFPSPDPDLKEE